MSGLPPDAAGVRLSRRQGLGCIGLGAFALGGAALCLVLGIRCMAKHDAFDCIGLWSVFPIVFAAVGLTSLAVGLQRFTAGREAPVQPRTPPLSGAWQPVTRIAPKRPSWPVPPAVIHLPGATQPEPARMEDTGDARQQRRGESLNSEE